MERTELLALIRDGRQELEEALARFDDRQWAEPLLPNGWTLKDLVGHLGFWEQRIATLYDILSAGDVPQDTVNEETLDELNARVYTENQLLPLGIVQENELDGYRAIAAVAQNAPEDDLFDPGRFPWTDGQPFYRFIAENTYEHYADHVPDLRAMLP